MPAAVVAAGELGHVAFEVLSAPRVADDDAAALEDRPEALDAVCVDVDAPDIPAEAVVDAGAAVEAL